MDVEPSASPDDDDDRLGYVPLAELVAGLVVDGGRRVDAGVGLAITVERMAAAFPLELRVNGSAGALSLRAAPPTQHVETTFLPVWHALRITVVREEDDGGDAPR